MTRTRFMIAALLQSFGVLSKTKRLTDAAFELQLMQDGEELLGSFCWRETEEIEDLSTEYWNLRRLERQENHLIEQLKEAEGTLVGAQSSRAEIVDRSKEVGQELFKKRETLFEKIEYLGTERDEIMAGAALIKRKHAALKMKADVLREDEDPDEEKIDQCQQELKTLKDDFADRKKELSEIDLQIEAKEQTLQSLQKEIEVKLQGSKGEATESFSHISKANRDITAFRAELGIINEEQAKAFREVGRFLNLNATREDCRKASKGYRGLLEQTRLLYKSVQWNRRLVERASD
jgi:chromosome segregation ATPase